MRAGGSHAKGASFERVTCKALSMWMTMGVRDDLFWRTAMSGGRATVQRKAGILNVAQQGDIGLIDTQGVWFMERFVVECKHVRDLKIMEGIVKGTGALVQFWNKLNDDLPVGRYPLLIARENRVPTILLTNSIGAGMLGLRTRHRLASIHTLQAELYLFDELLARQSPLSADIEEEDIGQAHNG